MARLRSDIWVSAFLRRCAGEAIPAVLRRRGATEAGAIFVKIDLLDGTSLLYAPAPQSLVPEDPPDRMFVLAGTGAPEPSFEIEERLAREIRFDPDVWIVEAESRMAGSWLLLANESR